MNVLISVLTKIGASAVDMIAEGKQKHLIFEY